MRIENSRLLDNVANIQTETRSKINNKVIAVVKSIIFTIRDWLKGFFCKSPTVSVQDNRCHIEPLGSPLDVVEPSPYIDIEQRVIQNIFHDEEGCVYVESKSPIEETPLVGATLEKASVEELSQKFESAKRAYQESSSLSDEGDRLLAKAVVDARDALFSLQDKISKEQEERVYFAKLHEELYLQRTGKEPLESIEEEESYELEEKEEVDLVDDGLSYQQIDKSYLDAWVANIKLKSARQLEQILIAAVIANRNDVICAVFSSPYLLPSSVIQKFRELKKGSFFSWKLKRCSDNMLLF